MTRQENVDPTLVVPFQLAIKALDSAEKLRRVAAAAAGNAKSGSKKERNREDDEAFGAEVTHLAVRVVSTCMFKRGHGNIPSTESLETYMKRLRLDRVYDQEKAVEQIWRCTEGYCFPNDPPRNQQEFPGTPYLTRSDSLDEALARASDFELRPEDRLGEEPLAHSSSSSLLSSSSRFHREHEQDGDAATAVDEVEDVGLNAKETPSTPSNRKRHSDCAFQPLLPPPPDDDDSPMMTEEFAQAMSPSISSSPSANHENGGGRVACGSMRHAKSLFLFQEDNVLRHHNGSGSGNGSGNRDKHLSALYPRRPAQMSRRSRSTPIPQSHVKHDYEKQLVADEMADVLLRVCRQLDEILARKSNYYGGIFHMEHLFSELSLLKKRVNWCLEYLSTGRFPVRRRRQQQLLHQQQQRRLLAKARNAPIDDYDVEEEQLEDAEDTSVLTTASLLHSPIRDVVGRIFWQELLSIGRAQALNFVPWKQFVDAFEKAYGPQPAAVMNRFKAALGLEVAHGATLANDKLEQDAISAASCFPCGANAATSSSDYFSFDGLKKMCMPSSSSSAANTTPTKKKRKSHVPKWIRNSMSCQMMGGSVSNAGADEDCDCCNVSSDDGNGNDDGSTGNTVIVCIESFAKFCTDHCGLHEGFIAVTDPGTHIECLGSVEDLSKEELQSGATTTEDHDDPNSSSSHLLRPSIVRELLGLRVVQLSCGGQHAAVLLEGGEVYTWGKGGFGRLGHGDSKPCTYPRRVSMNHTCAQVACGFAYTAAVTTCGQAYAWGAGENGRLGVGDEHDRNRPTKVLIRQKVKVASICAGSVHTCILGTDGHVYSVGKHEYTGHGSSSDILVPRRLDASVIDDCIVQLSVGPGGYHTIALTESNRVYTWGHNRVGQLGFPISDSTSSSSSSTSSSTNNDGGYFVPKPTWVKSIAHLDIATVVAGWGHSAVVTKDGAVYTCGRNFQGQLGLGEPDFTTVNERGHPYQSCFRQVKGDLEHVKVVQFACGGEHSIALSNKDDLYAFGKGHKGQLGLSTCETRYVPTQIQRDQRQTLQVACGNNCTLVLKGKYKMPSLFDMCHEQVQTKVLQSPTSSTAAAMSISTKNNNNSSNAAGIPPLVRAIMGLDDNTEQVA